MRRLLEYEEYTDMFSEVRKELRRIENSEESDIIKNYKRLLISFRPYEIDELIRGGAMNVFRNLLPLDEENEDVLWKILEAAGIIVNESEIGMGIYSFFSYTSPYYHEQNFKRSGLIRPIKWEEVK